jgi:Protein of unknown function (DUF2844)
MIGLSGMFVRRCGIAIAMSVCAATVPAHAALGDTVSSVQSDAVHMRTSVRVKQSANYAVHEMQAAGGTNVREYVSPAGKVFAVAWDGPARPDLQQLLGSYYQKFVQAVQASKAQRVGRQPISVKEPGLVVQMGGHQRAFVGRAYLPQAVPSAVTKEEIR